MALPTLPTMYTTRRNIYEAAMVHRRTRETDFYSQWGKTANYFNTENAAANKKSNWESNKSFQTSMDAWKVQQERETKTLNLKRRRLKLGAMLKEEREHYRDELAGLSTPREAESLDMMKERSGALRSAREERRKNLADDKLVEHFRLNNPDLRELELKQHQDHVISEWSVQEEEKKKQEEVERKLQAEFEEELIEKQLLELELEKQKEQERLDQEIALKEMLKGQVQELKLREREAGKLKQQEELLMREQWELDQLEERRNQLEHDRKKVEFGRVLLRQHAAGLRRRSRQVQEELEEDLKFLEQLQKQEADDRVIQTARKEKAQADATWMKQVVEEQIRLEKTREAELDMLYQDEAARIWQQREADWAKERTARERLMREVMDVRQDQIQSKLHEVKRQQEESLEEREELIRELEIANQMTHRDQEDIELQKTARKQEIEAQVTSRLERERAAQLHRAQELQEERQAEEDYGEFLHNEAQRLKQKGFQPKNFGRKQAWS